MTGFIIEPTTPEKGQYVLKYLVDKEDVTGETVQVVERQETVTLEVLKERIATLDAQIKSLQLDKNSINDIITKIGAM